MSLTAIGGTYEGKLSADGKSITGNWSQGPNPLPLNLTRATPETEWAIPAPPPKLPPMDANASPSFEVATIKPTKPDEQRKAFLVRGRRFQTINVSLNEMISFAYGVHAKQVMGAPSWAETDKFDIDAQPDGEGAPSDKQWKGMLQKLIVERFNGRFDFNLKWTPDDSQFGGMGAKIPPPTDSAAAPPGLYTAIQEQIGLKLDATKAAAEVLVIDHVEKPSEN
jgi:hypothetical protein